MKIKITENQFSKIRILAEQDEYMNKYREFCAEKIQEVNKIYSKVINSSIADFLEMNLNAKDLNNLIDKIENAVNAMESNMLRLWDNQSINGNENLDIEIENIASSVSDKISSLILILNPLEKLQDYEVEHNLTQKFDDVKPIEVQSF